MVTPSTPTVNSNLNYTTLNMFYDLVKEFDNKQFYKKKSWFIFTIKSFKVSDVWLFDFTIIKDG